MFTCQKSAGVKHLLQNSIIIKLQNKAERFIGEKEKCVKVRIQ